MIKVVTLNRTLNEARASPSDYRTPQVEALRRFTVTTPIDVPILNSPSARLPCAVECGWFDDVEAAAAAYGCASVAEFLAPGSAERWAARENVVVPGSGQAFPDGAVKLVAFLKRRPEFSVDAFQRYWRENHAPLVPRTPRLRRYVQSHLLPEHYAVGEPLTDGLAELWWDSPDDFQISWASPQIQQEQVADSARFLGAGPFGGMGAEIVLR